jgi:hypothetical protein
MHNCRLRSDPTAAYTVVTTYLCGAECEQAGIGLQLEVTEVLHHQCVRVLGGRVRVCVKQEGAGVMKKGSSLCVASMNADTTQQYRLAASCV